MNCSPCSFTIWTENVSLWRKWKFDWNEYIGRLYKMLFKNVCFFLVHVLCKRSKVWEINKKWKRTNKQLWKDLDYILWQSTTSVLGFDLKPFHSQSFFLWTFSFYKAKYYARPIRHSKVTDRGNSHNIPCWLLWQPGSQMHLTATPKPKAWSLSIKTSVDLCISYMFRQRDLLLLHDFVLSLKVQRFSLTHILSVIKNDIFFWRHKAKIIMYNHIHFSNQKQWRSR